MAKFVASKLSYKQEFAFYAPRRNGPVQKIGGVTILGGNNVRNPRTLVMPTEGVITEVSDEDAERLAAHPLFKQYVANGAMKMLGSRGDARKASADLLKKDGSAQLTEGDFKKRGRKPPKAVAQAKAEEEESQDADEA